MKIDGILLTELVRTLVKTALQVTYSKDFTNCYKIYQHQKRSGQMMKHSTRLTKFNLWELELPMGPAINKSREINFTQIIYVASSEQSRFINHVLFLCL